MTLFHKNCIVGASGGTSKYPVQRSLRFNSPDSAFLSRTPGSSGNRKTWTVSLWIKRAGSGRQYIFGTADTSGNNSTWVEFDNDVFRFGDYTTTYIGRLETTQVFRDFSAWGHLLVQMDTTQATASNRMKLYWNGVQITQFSTATYPSQNTDSQFNTATAHSFGRGGSWNANYLSAYLAEIHFVDGQALEPSSFTENDTITGEIIPKVYSGTYGTNGFYLNFSDNSNTTAATLGKDYSGNGNNFTPTNLSVTAGIGNDSLVDTPTSYGTDTFVGGEVRGNYCTWNPLEGSSVTLSNGNLDATGGSTTISSHRTIGTISTNSGKWYYEIRLSTNVGANPNLNVGVGIPGTTTIYSYDLGNSLGASSGDIIGVAFDIAAGKLWIAKNGTWVSSGNPAAGTNAVRSDLPTDGRFLTFANQPFNSVTYSANFGQRPFAYTAPSGFKALCDTNLPTPTIAKPNTVMDVVTYTGTGSSLTPTSSLGFSPDFVWIKSRSAATDHALYDIVRGAQARLESNNTDAEVTSDGGVTAFNSNGFTLGTLAQVNTNTATYVAWCWDGGTSTVTNTSGTISAQVRANASAGISIVGYIGNKTAGATFGHGLGVAPQLVIVKSRDQGAGYYWNVYHASLGATKYLQLESTAAAGTASNWWNDTAPTSSVVTLGIGDVVNKSGDDYIAYCFAPVSGYSSFGQFIGNGSSDGPFVYTGFRPRWILVKSSSTGGSTYDWFVYDTARDAFNAASKFLSPNYSGAEQATADAGTLTDVYFDVLSNGFKLRTSRGRVNLNAATFVYAAFAESPFQYARAR